MRARHAATMALFALTGGCSAFTAMTGPVGGWPAQRPVPVAGTDLFDYKGMIHCHSYLSHDSEGKVEDIAAAAAFAHLDFLVMTDHQTDASIRDGVRGRIDDTLWIVGAEIRTPQGTIIAFPLTTPLRRWMSAGALIAEANRQGGIAVMCHAETWKTWEVRSLEAIEIVNLHAGAMTANPLAVIFDGLFLPIRQLMQTIAVRDPEVFANWDRALRERHPFAPVGGGDAHASIRVLGPLGATIADYREVFLTVSTHILATECTEESIVEALRLGRSYVAFDVVGEGSGFDFRAVDARGVHLPGATVERSDALRLEVRTPATGTIELWHDGRRIRTVDGDHAAFGQLAPGVYRVEVRTRSGKPWLFSSSIRVLG